MDLVINDKTCEARGTFGTAVALLGNSLEGRKQWISLQHLRFERTHANIAAFKALFPDCSVKDNSDASALFSEFAMDAAPEMPGIHRELEDDAPPQAFSAGKLIMTPEDLVRGDWPFVMEPRDFQLANFNRFKNKPQWAIFSEQGTGKTKVAWDIISYRFRERKLDAVLILSAPKGVHAQWIEEQMPKHLWPEIGVVADYWDGRRVPQWIGMATPGRLQVFSSNIDSIIHARPLEPIEALMAHHRERLLVIVDESDSIKSAKSRRNKELRRLCDKYGVRQRAIMTGTPIAKDLTDEWAQLLFLNPSILGHKYKTSFMAQYCRMGGFEGRSVIGHRNVETFKRLTAPHIFRATKDQLNLPPKVYDSIVFDMSDEQKRHFRTLKDSFLAELANGELVTVNNAASLLVRLQQLSCGYLVDDDGTYHDLDANPRLDALMRLRERTSGKRIIWCRFNHDIELVTKAIGASAVSYYGKTKSGDRIEAKERFINDASVTDFVANPAAAGRGIDGMQNVCSLAIYYSNSFDAIHRWQSEDRIHRIGQGETATYFDLIARGSADRSILANLRNKKGLSNLVLDDIKRIIEEL